MSSSSVLWIAMLSTLVLLAIGLAVVLWAHNRKRWEKHYTITYEMGRTFEVREVPGGMIVRIPPGMTAHDIADRIRPVTEAHGYNIDAGSRWGWR